MIFSDTIIVQPTRSRIAAILVFLASAAFSQEAPKLAPTELKTPEYSLWVVPTGKPYKSLKKKIAELSKKYNTPDFEPHVTVIGLGNASGASESDVAAKAADLAKIIKPYRIRLKEIGFQDKYFRSFYLTVEQTFEVMDAGNKGRELYIEMFKKAPGDPEYFPHLSLLYGDMAAAAKEKIIADDLGGKRDSDISFKVSGLQLWVTTGKPDNWRFIKEFSLRGR